MDNSVEAIDQPTPDMIDYAKACLTEIYNYDLDAVLKRVDSKANSPISLEQLEEISDKAHETAQPDNAVNIRHEFHRDDNQHDYITLEWHIPTQIGREDVIMSLGYQDGLCCSLINVTAKSHIGDQYKMTEFESLDPAE